MARSILSVVAGFALWSILWVSAQAALAAAMPGSFNEDGSTDSAGILIVLLAVTAAISFAAGFTTARIARQNAMRQVAILTAIQFGIGVTVQISWWEVMPVWYHTAFLSLLLAAHPFGGRVAGKERPLGIVPQV